MYAMERKLRYELTFPLLHFHIFRIFVFSQSNKVGFGETGTAHKPSNHVFLSLSLSSAVRKQFAP